MSSAHAEAHAVTIHRAQWYGFSPVTIYVDYKPAAKIYGGQSITLYLSGGTHVIGVRSLGQDPSKRTHRIRIDVSDAGTSLNVGFNLGAATISRGGD